MMGSALERMAHGAMLVLVVSACYAESVSTSPPGPTSAGQRATRPVLGSRADTSDWRGTNPRTVADLLVDRFPGVDVRSLPGGGVSVRIRGAYSVLGTEPLYVVDGLPEIVGPNGALADLDPNDVQRIEVLKGPEAAALWGERGSNGVVVVTTKRH